VLGSPEERVADAGAEERRRQAAAERDEVRVLGELGDEGATPHEHRSRRRDVLAEVEDVPEHGLLGGKDLALPPARGEFG